VTGTYKPFLEASRFLFARPCLVALLLLLFVTSCGRLPNMGAAAQESARPDWRFGLIETVEAPADAAAAGAAWTRVRFHWSHVQAGGPDTWTPAVDDAAIDKEVADGRLVVGLLIGIPDWARGDDLLPRGLWLSPDDPGNLWANFVRQAVSRYRGRIDHWIIWNEPDIWDKDAPGHTWDGDVKDFAQLQRTAYLVAREVNPDAVVHLAAFTYFWDANYDRQQYLGRLLDVLADDAEAAENNYYFDVATAHLYFQPHFIYEILQTFDQIMADRGLEKPLWLVETNAPPNDDPAWPVADPALRVTLNEQAAFMPQALSVALAAGAERVAVYKLKDLESDRVANPEPFGLLRMDGSRRPAFSTYQVAVRYLSGVRRAERQRWDEVGQILLDQGGYTTTVLFSRLPAPQQARVSATAGEAVIVDMWGEELQTHRAENGAFTVELPPALCSQSIGDYCMIGGSTTYLVQAAPGGSLPDTLPAVHLSPTNPPPPSPAPLARTTALPARGDAAATAALPATPTPRATVAANDTAVTAAGVERNEAVVDFPDAVTFRLEMAEPPVGGQAILRYDVVSRECVDVSSQVPVTLDGNGAEWTWVMSRSGNPPPGTELWWEWTLTDADGNEVTTPRQSATLADDRFPWRTVEAGDTFLHWYEGDDVGPALLEAAVTGHHRLQNEMGIAWDGEVQFFIYADPAAMREAMLYVQEWAGGVAFTEYNTILMGVRPDQVDAWGRETVRHELAHLVLGQFAWSCLGGSRPTWLEEGLATYAEGPADEETLQDIARGIENGSFEPLRSLSGAFPAHSADASMAYSQSYSVVAFLLETYGQEKMEALLQALAQAQGYDAALEQVYGFNVDGLERRWRESIGAPPREIPPTPTPLQAAALPTLPPLTAPQTVPTPAGSGAQPSTSPASPLTGICGLGLAPLLFLGLVWGWARRSGR